MENLLTTTDIKPNPLDLRVELDDFDIGIFDSDDAQFDDTFITQLLDPELCGAADHVQTTQHTDVFHFCQSNPNFTSTNTLESLLKGPSPPEDTVTPAPATSSLSQPNLQTTSEFDGSGPAVHDTLIALLLKQKEDAKQRDVLIQEISVLLSAQGGQTQSPHEFSRALTNMNLVDLQQLHEQLLRTSKVKCESIPVPSHQSVPAPLIVTKADTPVTQTLNKVSGSYISPAPSSSKQNSSSSRPVTIRKSSHNAIEKRYRCSINDRIEELRNLLVGQDGKLSKSAVLRKSLERIRYLEKENERLRRELSFRLKESSRADSSSEDAMTPQSEADMDDDATSVDSAMSRSPSFSRPRLMSLLETKPMLPSATSVFMAPCLFFLLLGLPHFIGLDASNRPEAAVPGASSRHISWWNSEQNPRFSFVLRCIIYGLWILGWLLFCVLSSRLVFSWYRRLRDKADRQICDRKSAAYWQHWTQAEHDLTKDSFVDAVHNLELSLESCGAGSIPRSNTKWFIFSLKQLVCYYLGRMLPSTFDRNDAAAAARSYGRLLQLRMSGKYFNTEKSWLGWLVLATWNMLDMAEGALTGSEKLEIQCALGIAVRQCKPAWMGSIISNWFYSCCSQLVQSNTKLSQYHWISSEEGYRFLGSEAAYLDMNTTPYWCVLDFVNFEFVLLLQKRILVGIFNGFENRNCAHCVQLLERLILSTPQMKTPVQEASHWFSALVCSVAYTKMEYHVGVKKLHKTVNCLPASLKKTKLAQSLLLSYRVHHYLNNRISCEDTTTEEASMQACASASEQLHNIAKFAEDKNTQIWCILALDWLLDARSRFLVRDDDQLQSFQRDLDLLRILTFKIGSGYQKWVSHHAASLHVISHANPLSTGMLLRAH